MLKLQAKTAHGNISTTSLRTYIQGEHACVGQGFPTSPPWAHPQVVLVGRVLSYLVRIYGSPHYSIWPGWQWGPSLLASGTAPLTGICTGSWWMNVWWVLIFLALKGSFASNILWDKVETQFPFSCAHSPRHHDLFSHHRGADGIENGRYHLDWHGLSESCFS